MPAITGLGPIKVVNPFTRFFCGALVLSLLRLTALAQEPEANAESSTASSELSSSNKSSETPLYPSRDMRDKSLIAKVMDDEVQWLDTEYGKILALYRPTEAKTTHGVLILFHATENPQTWPPLLENLRAHLPRYGWETLAISLPQKYPAIIPARPSSSSASASASSVDAAIETESAEAETTKEETAALSSSASSSNSFMSTSSTVARDLLIQAYVDAALGFLKEKGQLNAIILADNSTAQLVLQTLMPQIQVNNRDASTMDGPLQALVITNLQNQEPINKMELEGIFSIPQLPVLDIFFLPDNPEQTEARDLHRAVAMRKKVTDYQQLVMDTQPKLTEQDHRSYLVGRIRGFMQRQASGTKAKASKDDKQDEQN